MKKHRYGVRESIRNYRFHSIFLKNLLLVFGALMLPFLCVLIMSHYSYNQIQQREKKAYADEMLARVSSDVENLFCELRDKMIMLAFDEDVKLFFYSKNKEDHEFYDFHSILDFISLYSISTDVIEDVYIYSPNNRVILSSSGASYYQEFYDKECIDHWSGDDMWQIEYVSRRVINSQKDTICLYYTTRYSGNRKGVVILQINLEKLHQKLNYGDTVSLAVIGNSQLLYDTSRQNLGSRIDDTDELLSLESASDDMVIQNVLKENRLTSDGLTLILRFSSAHIYEKLGHITQFIPIFIGVMLFITIALVFYISQKIFNPISEILKALDAPPNTRDKQILQKKDEVSYIRDAIDSTRSRNRDIEEELLERVRLLKKAQSVALQAQINPHFLNNTLEMINWMTIRNLGSRNDISEVLTCLSQLMRISLEYSDTFVTLKDEIEYVKKYLFIQQKRMENQFTVEWEIPEELQDCKVIKMMLQPVVENAIRYGIKPYDWHGKLVIQTKRDEDRIFVRVKDSGLGITKDEVDAINSSIRTTIIKESNHIGLSNVNQRIILAFGEEYGVTVTSEIGIGTSVILSLPYKL